jgi:MFS family permease
LFAVPGAARFSLAGWLARLPACTAGLGTVLLISRVSGSYGLAGAVSGALALAFAVASPVWARAIDRRGQGAVLRPLMGLFLAAGLAFLGGVLTGAPVWSWFVLAAATGAAIPNVGSLVRARWTHALPEARQRQTAFAFESVVDEVVFVVGPPVVTLLAALVAPAAGFLTGLLLGVGGGWWLARMVGTEPPPHRPDPSAGVSRWAALSPAVLVVALSSLGVGTVFGAMDVVVVAFAREQGAAAVAGLALAAYAAGSLLAGLVYGLLRPRGTTAARFRVCSAFFGLAAQTLLAVRSLPTLVGAVVLAGLAIAPALVAGMSLVESRVPRGVLTEALTWTNSALTVGVTVGAAVAGITVDAWGARAAFAVPCAAAGLAAVLALAGAPWLRAPFRSPGTGGDAGARPAERTAGA